MHKTNLNTSREFRRALVGNSIFGLVGIALLVSNHPSHAQETKRGLGLGALIGQAIGNDTESTLIGAGIGAGVGHVIGNERDKQKAQEMSAQAPAPPQPQTQAQPAPPPVPHNEVGSLGNTLWQLVSLNPKDIAGPYVSKAMYFSRDGILVTLTTHSDGSIAMSEESFRVVESTLVVNRPGYLINARFVNDGDQITVSAEKFSAVLKRLQPE